MKDRIIRALRVAIPFGAFLTLCFVLFAMCLLYVVPYAITLGDPWTVTIITCYVIGCVTLLIFLAVLITY